MRQGTLAGSNSRYFTLETLLNSLKRFLLASNTVEVLGVAIVDTEGNQISTVASTSTVTSVDDTASSVQLLAANTSRKGLFLYNTSSAIAYVKFGTTASATDFTLRLVPNGSYEMNGNVYNGRIDAIWASDASGAMLITELT